MEYEDFLKNKVRILSPAGFKIEVSELNPMLFDFQKHIVQKSLEMGRYAIFAECGLGKTPMQIEFAYQVIKRINKSALILAPLAVSGQTIREGIKFNREIKKVSDENYKNEIGIFISNYEQLENIDTSYFGCIVLDESSILKNFTGKYKNLIIDTFKGTSYKLACTATPSPNDLNEIGNHSEFLDALDAQDMRARWFVRDEGMNNYRLKNHATKDFFSWVSNWAVMITNPQDLGFDGSKFILPELNIIERQITTGERDNGKLFNDVQVNATNFNQELRLTKLERLEQSAEIINNSDESFIIWIKQNEEADLLRKLIPDAVEVRGNETTESKEKKLLGFANNEFRVLITKSKIAQFGLNFQNCHNQIFASLDFSFEALYQSIRRSYRFGQTHTVNIFIITTDTMQNVIDSIKQKEGQFKMMQTEMNKEMNSINASLKIDYDFKEEKNNDMWLMRGDSVEEIKRIESDSIDFSVFSPPFSSLFTYSDNLRDMGNCESNEEFFEQYKFLLKELYRIIKPGRLIAVHSKDLAKYKNSSGYTGLYDFTGDNHRAIEDAGFKYHSKITIWTDPVLEMQRTKTQRLLYKQVTSDSTYTGVGLPEYVTIFRKWEGLEEDWKPVKNLSKSNFPLDTWQKWASPVWMDIRRTDVLNNREGTAQGDEKHIAPLQLEVIKRCMMLWSNEGETIFTPFLGIGSEAFVALQNKRKAIGIELKESYFDVAVRNCLNVLEERNQVDLFKEVI